MPIPAPVPSSEVAPAPTRREATQLPSSYAASGASPLVVARPTVSRLAPAASYGRGPSLLRLARGASRLPAACASRRSPTVRARTAPSLRKTAVHQTEPAIEVKRTTRTARVGTDEPGARVWARSRPSEAAPPASSALLARDLSRPA